jgi:zinc protease
MSKGKNSFARGASRLPLVLALALSSPYITPAFAQDAEEAAPADMPAETKSGPAIWGIDPGDMENDPAIRYGKLRNGMKYAIQENEAFEGASIRFTFDVGKLDEEDKEMGYAHFVEHMAFNGSKKIPEGELLKKLTRLGLAFGADTNAETSLDYTTYKLEIPRDDDETLDAALLMMRELASELTLSPEAIDRERGIIMAEERGANVPGRRRVIDWLKLAMPESRIGYRVDDGDGMPVKKADAKALRSFYEGFYRPELATLSIVGYVDPDRVERKIRNRFADWQPTGAPRAKYQNVLKANRPLSFGSFVDPTSAGGVEIQRIRPIIHTGNTVADEIARSNEALAMVILNSRFMKLASAEGSPIVQAYPAQQDMFRVANVIGVFALGKADNWQGTLTLLEQEMRRAAEHGFTDKEVKSALTAIEASINTMVAQQGSRNYGQLADGLSQSSLNKKIIQTPAQMAALFNQIRPKLTAQSVSDGFRAAWGDGANVIHVTTSEPLANDKALIAAIWNDSKKVAVSAPVEAAAKAFAYNDFGKAGKVKSKKWLKPYETRVITFANGIRLNLRQTDFEAGKLNYTVRVGGGLASLPKDKPGFGLMMEVVSPQAGFGAHSIDEVREFTLGKAITLGFVNDGKAFISSGVTTRNDLALQMKVMAASLKDFGYRPEAQRYWESLVPSIQGNIRTSPLGVYVTAGPYILSDGDSRFGFTDPAVLEARNINELKSDIDSLLKTAPVEISLIGDFDEKEAIKQVAQSFGALPARPLKLELPSTATPQRFPSDRSAKTLYHDGQPDQGLIAMHWPTDKDDDLKNSMALELVAAAFNLELLDRVREKLGAAYTPQASYVASSDFKDYGYIAAITTATPEQIDTIRTAMKEIATDFRDKPLEEDLLLRARTPLTEQYDRDMYSNGSLSGPIGVAQSEPQWLPRRYARLETLKSITAEDVQAAAKRYLGDAEALEIRIIPRPSEKKK